MGRRTSKLTEDDLKSFLDIGMRSSGFLHDDEDIDGFLYSTRKIKAGGDYYKDVITDPHDTSESEEVKFIKVVITTVRRKKDDEEEQLQEDTAPEET